MGQSRLDFGPARSVVPWRTRTVVGGGEINYVDAKPTTAEGLTGRISQGGRILLWEVKKENK